MTPTEIGPDEVLQIAAGLAVPEIAKLITPAGAAALADPVTVAVKVTEPPRVGVEALVRTTVGVAAATVVEVVDATTPTALYPLSPGKVKVAV